MGGLPPPLAHNARAAPCGSVRGSPRPAPAARDPRARRHVPLRARGARRWRVARRGGGGAQGHAGARAGRRAEGEGAAAPRDAPTAATEGDGVYRPRRGGVGGGLERLSQEQRDELARTLGAELCLFKYDADPASDGFGRPLEGPPHAIYLDPQAAAAGAGQLTESAADAPSVGGGGGGGGTASGASRRDANRGCSAGPHPKHPRSVLLNRGRPLRPSGDARGWKWREQLLAKRDASLIFAPEGQVAHVATRELD